MKFAIIGSRGPNSFATKIQKALKKLGHSVYLLSNNEIKSRYCPSKFKLEYHIYQKNPMDLREVLPVENYDMIIISHSDLVFNNPRLGSTKVLYYHRELLCYPSCTNPHVIAYNMPTHDKFMWHYYPTLWNSAEKIDLPFAVDPEEFNPNKKKDLPGINYVSVFEKVMVESRDHYWNYNFKTFLAREKQFCSNGHVKINGDEFVLYEGYKNYLERSEAFLVFCSPGIYGSRRMVEIAACKSLPVIHIENKEAEQYYNDMGFYNGETCVMFKDDPHTEFLFYNKYRAQIIEDAYYLVLFNHTYNHRAEQIIELLK